MPQLIPFIFFIINNFWILNIINLLLQIFSLLYGLGENIAYSAVHMTGGEGPQSSWPGHLSGGESSPQGPQNPGPERNIGIPNFNNDDPDVKDSTRLAHFFETNKDNGHFFVKDAGIRFTKIQRQPIRELFYEDYSRMARYFHMAYPRYIFQGRYPQNTIITHELIQKLKDLHENVPLNYH
jgi:hypothetical protein